MQPRSLRLQAAFDLCARESIKFKPSYADRGDHIALKGSWTKGGRERTAPIITQEQRAALDDARRLAGIGSLIQRARPTSSNGTSMMGNAKRPV